MIAPIRVVVADDHPIVRAGICNALDAAEDITVVGKATNGDDALRQVKEHLPDVLLLDIEMPKRSGIDVARDLQDDPVRILILSSYDNPEYASGVLQAGASGYLTKDKAPLLILDSVRAVHRGEVRWFVQPQPSLLPLKDLTNREVDVLRQLALGKSNAAIADTLHVSVNTVRSHVVSIYDKLELESGREAIAWVWQNGLMSQPGSQMLRRTS